MSVALAVLGPLSYMAPGVGFGMGLLGVAGTFAFNSHLLVAADDIVKQDSCEGSLTLSSIFESITEDTSVVLAICALMGGTTNSNSRGHRLWQFLQWVSTLIGLILLVVFKVIFTIVHGLNYEALAACGKQLVAEIVHLPIEMIELSQSMTLEGVYVGIVVLVIVVTLVFVIRNIWKHIILIGDQKQTLREVLCLRFITLQMNVNNNGNAIALEEAPPATNTVYTAVRALFVGFQDKRDVTQIVITDDHTRHVVEVLRMLTTTTQNLKFWDQGLGSYLLWLADHIMVVRVCIYSILCGGFAFTNAFFIVRALTLVALFESGLLARLCPTVVFVTRIHVEELRCEHKQFLRLLLLGSSIRCWKEDISTASYSVADEPDVIKKDPCGVFYRMILSLAAHLSIQTYTTVADLNTTFNQQLERARPGQREVYLNLEIMELIHFLSTDAAAQFELRELRNRMRLLPPGNQPIFGQKQMR
jgi:hypothetical protein